MFASETNRVVTRPLTAGIYAPVPSFFLPESEDLDILAFEAHIVRLAKAGISPLVSGTMGEAIHLSHTERTTLIKTARKALDGAGYQHTPVIAGAGAGSTRETIELCKEAAEAEADYVIVIISGYFAGVLAGHRKALKAFWTEVSAKSPIPVLIYNYPGACGGIDLDSDLITELAIECPNLAGVKLTCGNVGKLTRICATVSNPSFARKHPRKNPDAPFLVLGGYADFIIPATFVNGHGAITGTANLAPHAMAKLYHISQKAFVDPSFLPEAQSLQAIIARADFTIAKASVAGTKCLLQKLHGYGGVPRKPLPQMAAVDADALWVHPHVKELFQLEKDSSDKFQ